MALNIEVKEIANHSYIVDLNGSLDNESYSDLEMRFKKISHQCTKAVCLNMKRVSYISSAGIGVLVSERKLLSGYHALMALVGLQPAVRKVFDLMKLSPIFLMLDELPRTDEEVNGLLTRYLGTPAAQAIH